MHLFLVDLFNTVKKRRPFRNGKQRINRRCKSNFSRKRQGAMPCPIGVIEIAPDCKLASNKDCREEQSALDTLEACMLDRICLRRWHKVLA